MQSQHISVPVFEKPADIVQQLGAVQSQDYAGAKWAIGMRLQDATDAVLEEAFDAGSILRTHVMRPTWHFVTPADIRWMLELTAPRVNALAAGMYRNLELDKATFTRCNKLLAKALQGDNYLMRTELMTLLEKAKIVTTGLRGTHIMFRAELDGIVCSGPRKGKQFTYALLEERAPQAKILKREEALGELTLRYFNGHGPATVADFVWWSGLTATDARKGLDIVGRQLTPETIAGQIYWCAPGTIPVKSNAACLLPAYDEYTVGYRDRSAMIIAEHEQQVSRGNVIFSPQVLINGRTVGVWQRTLQKDTVTVTISPFTPLNKVQLQSVTAAAKRYAKFLGLALRLSVTK